MSIEIFRVQVDGETRWRCAHEGIGKFSLDDQTIEPFVATPEDAVSRVYGYLHLIQDPEVRDGRQFVAEMHEHLRNLMSYRRGACLYDLDGFQRAVAEIRSAAAAETLELSPEEIQVLTSMAEAISQEVRGDPSWKDIVRPLDREVLEQLYLKLFPDWDPCDVVVRGHSALSPDLVPGLDSGFRYMSLLAGTAEMQG